MPTTRNIRYDIFVVILLALIVFLVAALATYDPADNVLAAPEWLRRVYQPDQLAYPLNERIQNACGFWGAWTADVLTHALGFGAYYVILGLIALEFALVRQQKLRAPWIQTTGWTLSLIGLTGLFSYAIPTTTFTPVIGPGGYLGALTQGLLGLQFGTAGGIIFVSATTLVGLMMWTEYLVFRAGRVMFAPALIAASALLPFGLLNRFMSWWNGQPAKQRTTKTFGVEATVDQTDLPRTIKINKQELSDDELPSNRIVLHDRQSRPETFDDDTTSIISIASSRDVDDEEFEDVDDEHEGDDEPPDEPEKTAAAADETNRVHAKPHFTIKPAEVKAPKTEREVVMSQLNEAARADSTTDYELPNIDMLIASETVSFGDQKREALQKADVLERTCKEFGYTVRVVEIETGPVISQYEIQLEAGLRLQKITALADDLAIALRVPSVRIVAPIPGKNTVGVEVPNESRQIVRLREVIEQSESKTRKMKIPLFLGKDAVGAPMVVDLATLPHLLIAGRTGTGKSVCLNAIITSILMTRRPDEVRMLMIDPKMVELSGYARLPHLMHPVVTDMRKAEAILAWAVDKMEERYALLARAGVRHISSYNQLGLEELTERLAPESEDEKANIPVNLPFIVIVADEMADLMMTSGKEVEQHIIRLAQKSRAVGIHLILATQKPTVDVITGLIKSNLPARIAFQVASKMDSRVVLDAMGAEKLLGNGDLLFLWPGTSTLLRGQGTYLTDDEIESVTESVSTGEQNFVHELMHIKVQKPEGEEGSGALPNRDDLYESAVDVVIREGRGSVSLLQRALGIGYGRAARLIDFMEQDGVVGTYNGSKSREVIMTLDQWQEMQSGSGGSRNDSSIAAAPVVQSNPPGRVTKLAGSRAISPLIAKPKLAAVDRNYEDEDENEDDDESDSANDDDAEAFSGDDTDYDSEEDTDDEFDDEIEDR